MLQFPLLEVTFIEESLSDLESMIILLDWGLKELEN